MTAGQTPENTSDRPADSDACRPSGLHLDKKDGLRIEWADGRTSHYALAHLRKHCPCAACRAPPQAGHVRLPPTSLTVLPPKIDRAVEFTGARLVGRYAIQIEWADGHNTGIYDFNYLRTICVSDQPGEDPPAR